MVVSILTYHIESYFWPAAKDNKLSIGGKEIKFNINTIRWLGIILDPGLKLKVYVD